MARTLSMKDAINEAIDQEMGRDPTVIMMGEDIVGGAGADGEDDAWGGVLGVTKGLFAKYPNQMIDTPLSESAYVGAAVGAATCGLRPIAELMFVDFLGVCFDQDFQPGCESSVTCLAAKLKHRLLFGRCVVRGFRAAAQHSQMLTPIVTHIPGLKVVCPSNAYDTKGLLIQAIRDNDPVIFLEHKNLYASECDVPEEPYAIPFGEANVVREGGDVTIVTYGLMVQYSLAAADMLKKEGIEVEVIDLRTLSPIDMDTVIESVEETGRLVCVDEACPRCSIATDVSACVARDAFKSLKAPIEMVTATAFSCAVLTSA